MALIELSQLCKTYQSGEQQIKAVDHVDLTIEAGEFCVLAGPSGSGKTTLLNLIGCLDEPTSGTICLDGEETSSRSVRELADFRLHNIGFIFQAYNLIPVLTAEENAAFALMLLKIPVEQRRQRVHELFATLGLEGLEKRKPSDLSGGQQQRVAVARAMASSPAVILADEPTANLDSATSAHLLEMMHQLNQEQGTTFVFSSHDPLVINKADRVIELHDGQLRNDTRRMA
ncbi:ABC transporter ATP-binding protein [Desulfuromonas acetoxidans]|uniref:ABC transporter ATP-binding protein n=1 Tax=Desulfuromonas acetoxidans TaxID=891 RepID=UPI00292E0C83|nr:ABC transporter ATP-binding protein [Desulfuromonas acetoxidans]